MPKSQKTYLSIIGRIDDLNHIIKDIYQTKDINFVDAMTEVEEGRFHLPLDEENIDIVLGFSDLRKLEKKDPYRKEIETYLEVVQKYYKDYIQINPDLLIDRELKTRNILDSAQDFVDRLEEKSRDLEDSQRNLEELKSSLKAYSFLQEIKIPMKEFNDLKHFSYFIGSLTKENDSRLNMIYKKIPSVMFYLGNLSDSERVFMVITPNDFKIETERVLKSLDFKLLNGFNRELEGTPQEILNELRYEVLTLEEKIITLQTNLTEYIQETQSEADVIYNELALLISLIHVKNLLAYNKTNFFLSAFVPVKNKAEIQNALSVYKDIIINFEDQKKTSHDILKLRKKQYSVPTGGILNLHKLR